jgi:hypothetical protein
MRGHFVGGHEHIGKWQGVGRAARLHGSCQKVSFHGGFS